MKNKKGFQLSINMLVVIILGLVMMGVGTSLFFNAYNKVVDTRETVDSQTQAQLDNLLTDEDALLALPIANKDVKRGDYVDFNLALVNELQRPEVFYLCYEYTGSTAYPQGNDPFLTDGSGSDWFLVVDQVYPLENNERDYIPIRIAVPKKDVLKGQYIFTVKMMYFDNSLSSDSEGPQYSLNEQLATGKEPSVENICLGNANAKQYGSTQKISVTV